VLIIDDQKSLRVTLAMMLRGSDYEAEEAATGKLGVKLASEQSFDVVLTDLRMEDADGIEVLKDIKRVQPTTEVILMTAYGTIENAVEAMRLGAFDYIQKPFREDEIFLKIDSAIAARRARGQSASSQDDFRRRHHFERIIGHSEAMRSILIRVAKVAPTDTVVLITGESGTGKELIARAVHANSRRADKAFVTVNCAAITETLLESELFGHARGAFTGAISVRKGLFEEASGGTFFFDEIAETTPAFQAKLLRALQNGEVRRVGENKPIMVDIRVVAATNVDLSKAVRERTFREDLYYRLNVARFDLPPLRERREDVAPLAEFLLDRFNRKLNMQSALAPGVLEHLLRYDFPGNIRELENMIEQAVTLAGGGLITLSDIIPQTTYKARGATQPLVETVNGAEREAIEAALNAHAGNRERAALALHISPTTLWRKMTRLGISYDNR
jgi:two-component system, NtrC family, response regulator HydG